MSARPDERVFRLPAISDLTLQYADSVARRVHNREAPIRWSFVRNFEAEPVAPPMARMLRGGRGGGVRLKLYLSFLWFAAAWPHDVQYPARAWAGLLGLEDPEVNGARRIIDAIDWLGEHKLVRVRRQRGRPSEVRLLRDDGSGEAYELPGETVERLRKEGVDGIDLHRHFYLRLPSSFWTNGWCATLSGPAIAMLLSLLAERADRPEGTELWLSPAEASRRIGLVEDTRSKGLRELVAADLVDQFRRSISRDVFDFRRLRNVYVLRLDRLDKRADE